MNHFPQKTQKTLIYVNIFHYNPLKGAVVRGYFPIYLVNFHLNFKKSLSAHLWGDLNENCYTFWKTAQEYAVKFSFFKYV